MTHGVSLSATQGYTAPDNLPGPEVRLVRFAIRGGGVVRAGPWIDF